MKKNVIYKDIIVGKDSEGFSVICDAALDSNIDVDMITEGIMFDRYELDNFRPAKKSICKMILKGYGYSWVERNMKYKSFYIVDVVEAQ